MRYLLLFFVLGGLFSGCNCGGEPCDPNTDLPRCEENTVVSCPPPEVDQIFGANQWRRHDCTSDEACVSQSELAFCALSSEPNPACGDGGVTSACEDPDTFVYCTSGFATGRNECIRCDSNDAGVECVGGPSARCAGAVDCKSGFCGANGFCGTAPRDGGESTSRY